ncbi:MAG TPA: DUF1203 domain-containing protein [Kofleriaceae bacterium]|nr:DUF1203 domain-containing protein [Kofleriaceae bacterium]
MRFFLRGIDPTLFAPWFSLSDDDLRARGALRRFADSSEGHPCRVSLAEAAIGEELLLAPYEHHATSSPYRGAGPVYIRRSATKQVVLDEVPPLLLVRMLSVRAYDETGMMQHADVVDGRTLAPVLEGLFDRGDVAYVHVHYAKPGCFACVATRAK